MNLLVVLLLAALLSACASTSGSAPPPTDRQTVSISLPPSDALGGGIGTEVVSIHRDSRGSRHRIGASPAEVWPVLVRVYNGLEIPLGSIEPAERRLGNTALVVQRRLAGEPISRFLDCGTDNFGRPVVDSYQVTVSLLSTLTAGEGGTTQMETRLSGSAVNRGVSGAPVHCGSTGRLEEQIARRLQQQLNYGSSSE